MRPTVTVEQWGKVYEVFDAAVRLPPRERPAFLGRACRDDLSLLTEVRELLSEDDKAGDEGFLEPPFPAVESEPPPNFDDHPRYRLIRKLGEGGMGTVYLAEHRIMERLVALKVIRHDLIATPELLKRFHQEVRAAARLIDRNIVTAYDAEEVGDSHVLVMEYVEGTDLARWLKSHGPMPPSEACDAICQVALGLQYAFEREMVHRDIKPQNIMRTPKGQIKILDFGVARLTSEVGTDAATSAILGTANFIAPEQIEDSEKVDIRADIYSLGCTLYYLLSGQLPFPDDTPGATVEALDMETPRPIGEIPEGLNLILARMMAKEPEGRYQTPGEVALILAPFVNRAIPGDLAVERHQDGLEPTVPRLLGEANSATRPRLRRPGTLGIWVGATLLGICILGVGFAWLNPDRQAAIVAEVEKLGGKLIFDEGTPERPVIEVDLSNTRASDGTLERLAVLTRLRLLNLMSTPVSDEGLRHLNGLTSLRVLNLHRTAMTDNGLERLQRMPNLAVLLLQGPGIGDKGLWWVGQMDKLENLELSKTSITDGGLARLRSLTGLRRLTIEGTRISDVGLEHLKELTQLRWLNLSDTQVTDAGVSDFQKALPGVEVIR